MAQECKRCGKCCLDVGSTFWTHGNVDADEPFGDHVLLNKLANNRGFQCDSKACEMFKTIGGENFCAVERYAGRKYKPVACREYPEDGGKCFYDKTPNEELDNNERSHTRTL